MDHVLNRHQSIGHSSPKMRSTQYVAGVRSPGQDPYLSRMKIQMKHPSRSRLLNVAVISPKDIRGYREPANGLLGAKAQEYKGMNWQQQYWQSMFPRRNSKAILPEPLKREGSQPKLGHHAFDQMKKQLSRTRLAATVVETSPSRHDSKQAPNNKSLKSRQAPDFALKR